MKVYTILLCALGIFTELVGLVSVQFLFLYRFWGKALYMQLVGTITLYSTLHWRSSLALRTATEVSGWLLVGLGFIFLLSGGCICAGDSGKEASSGLQEPMLLRGNTDSRSVDAKERTAELDYL
eukprot:NODE_3618_length_650_cov_62.136439_g2590_i0.p2 GENE.NODE_3618_length_650_cov_62.136439_g2590_i0~~NODE_3618_length_650_cov_62.136439_g2590_i0.p2  ORF type:complete len:124 (+),score=42.05 NODE_3618_length_650_cov_62.136439_g2590_i0:211-582(+)